MTEEEVEAVFEENGYSKLYHQLQYKLWLNGELDLVDASLLDSFFDAYTFVEYEDLLFDEFMYHFRMYQNVCQKNDWTYPTA
ncbi:hypothetical protein LS684_17380 [Cytobacillus spongiae]|uniref:hypothetical protein n=1 Tax=Cytobacillus spongiae TaxID=2901381 RepID=UPI001F40DD99|nr:hypothetical protein [Cytobacillus spongiae]UII55384.1 hypothetical protein LS684_17380 [Cytobacillus spongiae]